MLPISIPAIEQEARRLRAEEMQRVSGLVSARLRLYGQLIGASALSGLIAVGEILRPLLSWNPQDKTSRPDAKVRSPGLPTRLSRIGRRLFSWNPQARRSC